MKQLLIATMFYLTGCAGTLGDAQQRAIAAHYKTDLASVGIAQSAECQALDDAHSNWLLVERTLIVLSGGSGVGGVVVPETMEHHDEAQLALAVSSGVLAGAAFFAGEKAALFKVRWVERCTMQGVGQ